MTCGSGEYVRLMENYPLVTGEAAVRCRRSGLAAIISRCGPHACPAAHEPANLRAGVWSSHTVASALPRADVFLRLDKKYQDVIADICKRMGAGMAEFVTDEAAESEVRSREEEGGGGGEPVRDVLLQRLAGHWLAGWLAVEGGIVQLQLRPAPASPVQPTSAFITTCTACSTASSRHMCRPAPQVDSVQDYDLYCHYVAGLVGIGLSQLFASSGEPRLGGLQGMPPSCQPALC